MAEITLKCVMRYHQVALGEIHLAGTVFTVDEVHARRLLADAPECFERVNVKSVRRPPRNKAIQSPPVDK